MSVEDVLKKYGPESEPTSVPESGVDAILARYPEARKPRRPWYAGLGTAARMAAVETLKAGPKRGVAGLKGVIEAIEPRGITPAMGRLQAVYERQMERARGLPILGPMVPVAERLRGGVAAAGEDIGGGFALADWLAKGGMTKGVEYLQQRKLPRWQRPESALEAAGLLVGAGPIEEARLPIIGKLTSPVNLAFLAAGGVEGMARGDAARLARDAAEVARRNMVADFLRAGRLDVRARRGGAVPKEIPTEIAPKPKAEPARMLGLAKILKAARETKVRELVETVGQERGAIRAGPPSRTERIAAKLGKSEAQIKRIEREIQGESRGATQPTVKQVEFLRRFIRATEQATERGAPSGVADILKTLREERGELKLPRYAAPKMAEKLGMREPYVEKVVERLKKAQKEAGPQPLPGGVKKPAPDIPRIIRLLRSEKGAAELPSGGERRVRALAKKTGLTEAQTRRIVNRLKGEAKMLEREKWLTPSQARGIKRAVTAQELEGLTKGEASQAQVNKLIRMLRARAKTGVAQKIIEKRTGARTIGKEVSFEDRKLIARDLLEGIPEGHRPAILAKALGKASMKEMGPEEIGAYIEKLKQIPGIKDINALEMLMGSPHRIWPQLGEKAYEAQRMTRQFLESVDMRAREAMKPIRGAMTKDRKQAIFDAIEYTTRTGQELTPQLKVRIGEGAEPFVRFARELGDELFGMLKAVNPSVKYRRGHILHYWKRTGFWDKILGAKKGELKPWETKFEQMPAELPVGTTIRTAGEQARRGAPGFERDPFEALRLEVFRVAFKVHWEPVLRDMRAAIAEAPPMHKMALEQWMGSLKGREGTTDWAVRKSLQWIYDNVGIKRQAPYKPLTRGGRNLVALRYNAVLSTNPGPVVKNFFQRINTYAEFGDEPRALMRGIRKSLTGERLKLAKEHGVIEDFEARELLESFRTGAIKKLQTMGMKGFNLMERWNRTEAFSIGYEWGLAKGMAAEQAVKAGLKGVADTQFLYGKIGMPAAFRNPMGRVLLQLGSWPVKQTEWVLRHASEAIKAGQVGDRAEALRHWGVLGRYAVLNAGIIVAAEKAGLDVRDFLGLGQFDFRNPMWLKTLWTVKRLPTDPVARYEFMRELKTSWPPAGVAISKGVRVTTQPLTPAQKVLAVLSVRTKEKGRLSRLYSERVRLQGYQEVAGKKRRAGKEPDRRREREVRRKLREINRDIEELERETGKTRRR